MSRSALVPLIPVVLLACNNKGDAPSFTEDVRIDMATDDNNPDSFGTKMCVTDQGVVYVLWLDDREDPGSGSFDIWMNRSVNRGGSNTEYPDLETADESGWLPAPVKVNHGDGNVWNPDLYCNEVGVFVVWEDDRDGELQNHQIYFNRSIDQGETFNDEDKLLEVDPDGFSMSLEPRITGSGENIYVAWYDSINGAYDILVNFSGDAGTEFRDVPSRVDSDDPAGSAYSARPKIAISDDAQQVWVAWEDSRDGKADVYFARSETGGVDFEEDQRLDEGDEPGAADSFEPQICADGSSGSIYVVWHDARSSEQNRDIYMNYSSNGGAGWLGNAQRLDSDNAGFANSLFPVCAAVGNTAHVAWFDGRDNGYDVYYRKLVDGTTGAEEVRIDNGTPEGLANSLDVRLANDGDNVVVAWRDDRAAQVTDNDYDDLYYNYSLNGAPFITNPNVVEGEGDFRIDSMYDGQSFKRDLNLAVLGGQWYAAWTDGRGGTSDIYFQRMDIGKQAVPPQAEAAAATTAQ